MPIDNKLWVYLSMKLTQQLVTNLFYYHEDGYLIWKENSFNKGFLTGKKAGYTCKLQDGDRRMVRFLGKAYYISRIIFLYHKGYLPKNVDHEDRNRLNDKIGNLRDATTSQNQMNSSCERGKYKYKGVFYSKGKWCARIGLNKKQIYLGTFITNIDAALAYNNAAKKYFGQFANLNIIS